MPGWLGHFFPTLSGGVRIARMVWGTTFFHVCPFDRGGRGSKAKAEQPKCNKSRERRAVAAARDQIRNNSVSGRQQFLQTVKLSIKSVALEFAKSVGSSVLRLWLLATKPGNLC